eukprot:7999205-Pyramimonas_sp.AAC.1
MAWALASASIPDVRLQGALRARPARRLPVGLDYETRAVFSAGRKSLDCDRAAPPPRALLSV